MMSQAQEVLPSLKIVPTSFAHRGFVLIGASLILFEIVFLFLYANPFWFAFNILPWGIPSIVLVAAIAHRLLLLLESPPACSLFSFLFKGRPAIVYWRWVTFDETVITFGIRRILWQSIDEASLTIFGNLVLKSRSVCGPSEMVKGRQNNAADIIAKLPFSALVLPDQKLFVQNLQRQRPSAALNQRLIKQSNQPLLKGMGFVQSLAVLFLAAALIDFGYSEFRHLEILKEYFLCQKDCASGTAHDAAGHLARGEEIRLHPLLISWISNKVMVTGTIAAGIAQARSEALWAMKRYDDAIVAAKEAAEQSPKSFAYRLRLARLYSAVKNIPEAQGEIEKAKADHKDALLPVLYTMSMFFGNGETARAKAAYDDYMKDLNNEVFTESVVWPPGGEPFLHELFRRDDLNFVFAPLIDHKKD
jgi:tetratricopeptide (TPR) repeat protein